MIKEHWWGTGRARQPWRKGLRGDEEEYVGPADAVRYRERSAAGRTNARLKDELAAAMPWSRGTSGRWSNAPNVAPARRPDRSGGAGGTRSSFAPMPRMEALCGSGTRD